MKAIDELRALVAVAAIPWTNQAYVSAEDRHRNDALYGADQCEEDLELAIKAVNTLPALLAVAEAADVVAKTDWRSSVSEQEHYHRIDKMDALRASLAALEKTSEGRAEK